MTDHAPDKPAEPKKPPSVRQIVRAFQARLESAGCEAAIIITPSKRGAQIVTIGNPAFVHGLMVYAYPAITGEEPPEVDPAGGD